MKKIKEVNNYSKYLRISTAASFLLSSVIGALIGGFLAFYLVKTSGNIFQVDNKETVVKVMTQEERIVDVVKQASEAVVSVIVSKDLPVIERYYEEYSPFGSDPFFRDFFGDDFFSPFQYQIPQYRQKGTEKQEVAGGTGFIVSADGLVITNKHVIEEEDAEYTILTNEGEKIAAKVLATDPIQDIAVLKVDRNNLPVLELGDSDSIEIGQTVIAIGNALGEFRNTVSTGVISGLRRSITATSGYGQSETLSEVIQTDAAINPGNSGGPLLNLEGKVIGINVAMAQGAENIGFALPINLAKRDLEQVESSGKISYPFLGIRYVVITPEIKEKNNLSVDYGALIIGGEDPEELAVIPGSAADKAGLVENDIILEFDGQKIDQDNSLGQLITKKNVGDTVNLKILHKGKEKQVSVKLDDRQD